MSHFLDRLNYFSAPREAFAGDHGVTTGEDRTWEDAYRARWQHLQRNGMDLPFGWRHRVGRYVDIYRHLVPDAVMPPSKAPEQSKQPEDEFP